MRIFFSFLTALVFSAHAFADHLIHSDYKAEYRKGVTSGYYLGFSSFPDKLRELRLPSDIPESNSFWNSFYLDFHYGNQEFNAAGFYDDDALKNDGRGTGIEYDSNRSNNSSGPLGYSNPSDIEHDLYGITIGFGWGANPNLDVKIPLSASRFEVDHLNDTGFVGGIELFPNYRINEYVAWGVNLAYINSVSDFPIFDESMTSVSFEAMAESSPAYGINWSGRLSMGHYYPSNDANDDSFWLFKGALALHYQLHDNFTFLPFVRANHSTGDVLTDSMWLDYGIEFILMPNSPWNFSLGMAGVGGNKVIEEGLEFYFSTKGNF